MPSRTTPITSPTVVPIVLGYGPQMTASIRLAGVALVISRVRWLARSRARTAMRAPREA
ncbi:MAG: hypothetical protein IPK33_23440 [Gemmatimonadetes bacterium]|nr:hypothetical protein [Gemmatimonadota bacterium]